jgi:hypothetical protein
MLDDTWSSVPVAPHSIRHLRRRTVFTAIDLNRRRDVTDLLKKAFEEASKLPPDEQDAFAALMLEELAAETKWSDTLATRESQELLSRLADEALEKHRAGRTELLDPEKL